MDKVEFNELVYQNQEALDEDEFEFGIEISRLSIIVNKLFNSLENQKCDNCKYENKITMSGGARSCLLLEIGIGKDFGCNKWEAKDG